LALRAQIDAARRKTRRRFLLAISLGPTRNIPKVHADNLLNMQDIQ